MSALKYCQSNTLYLAGYGVVVGATSVVLTSLTDIYANVLTMTDFGAFGYITLEPDTTNEEAATFTGITANANGTYTLTGVKTVLAKSPYTETSGLVRAHAGGTKLVVTDNVAFWNTFTNKNNDETVDGQWTFTNTPIVPGTVSDASTTVKGVSKLSVAPVLASNPIAVGNNDVRVPSADPTTLFAPIANAPSGLISMYAGAAAPTGWLLCDGSSVLNASYSALFAIIGTTYGSADGSHFNVPDLRGRVPVGVGTGTGGGAAGTGLPAGGTALTAVARGGWKGEETHTLTTPEMPAHVHAMQAETSNTTTGGSNVQGRAVNQNNNINTGSTGGDGAHANIQPEMGVTFIIKT